MKIATAIVLGVALAATGTVAFAARNSSGTYALPSGNPVVGGTQISSTWANNTLGDLAQGVTDSLDRNGRGSMLAPLRVPNGTVTAPTVSFTNETGTGLYRIGAGNPAMSVLGSKRQEWTSTGTVVTGTLGTTGDAAVGGTFGVTGASTFTGAVGFSVAPTLNSGAFIAAGGLTLTETGNQTISKSGGDLNVNVATGQTFAIQLNGVTKWQMDGTGKFGGDGTNVITGVALPSGTSDVATKGYVDGRIRYVGTATISNTSTSVNNASAFIEADANYTITVTPTAFGGTPAVGSSRVRRVVKTTTGYTIEVEVAPGAGTSVTFDVQVTR